VTPLACVEASVEELELNKLLPKKGLPRTYD
jgi:hypothetical protein